MKPVPLDHVWRLHDRFIDAYGGVGGIRDLGLLESALAQPHAEFFGEPLCADLYEMAAAYCFHIIQNHPFVDGNKRTGIISALVFLDRNGITLDIDFDSLYEIAISVASSEMSKEQLAEFFKQAHNR
jgi:death-on-curing protein